MPSQSQIKHYRLVQWALSKSIANEQLDEDPQYTFDSIVDREYRYECSIISCRSMRDLRMTPSGIFCASHYLPWQHLDSNGNREKIKICYSIGCMEPPVSTLMIEHPEGVEINGKKLRAVFQCRTHQLPPLSDAFVAEMAELLCHINSESPGLFGSPPCHYGANSHLDLWSL